MFHKETSRNEQHFQKSDRIKKINLWKSIAFLCINNKNSEKAIMETLLFMVAF